jgi:hypothetical protein
VLITGTVWRQEGPPRFMGASPPEPRRPRLHMEGPPLFMGVCAFWCGRRSGVPVISTSCILRDANNYKLSHYLLQ